MLKARLYGEKYAQVITVLSFLSELESAKYLRMSNLRLETIHGLARKATGPLTEERQMLWIARSIRAITDFDNLEEVGIRFGVGRERARQLILGKTFVAHGALVRSLVREAPGAIKLLADKFGYNQWPYIERHFPDLQTEAGRANLHLFIGEKAAGLILCQLPGIPQEVPEQVIEPGVLTGRGAILLININLSVRLRNRLASVAIWTLGDLAEQTSDGLLRGVRNFGKRCLVEVEEVLSQHGLSLVLGSEENDRRSLKVLLSRQQRH